MSEDPVTELSQVEAAMTSHPPVIRRSRGVYAVNPDYVDLAERQHELLEVLSHRGMSCPPCQTHPPGRSVVSWQSGRHQEGRSAAAGTPEAAVRLASLRQSVSSRALIGQAQGILMERHQLSPEQAFARLRHLCHASQGRMHAVARQVVLTGPTPELMVERQVVTVPAPMGHDRCYG